MENLALNAASPAGSQASENPSLHRPHKGLIVFCDEKLRYEGGFKAWMFLVPYFLGAIGLEWVIAAADRARGAHIMELGAWLGFLAYLVLFPALWRRVLKVIVPKKTPAIPRGNASAIGLP
jgi:hypothetical protein